MAPDSRVDSSIRVLVDWNSQSVFAGEEIKCIITFKNISTSNQSTATTPTNYASSAPATQNNNANHHQRQPSRSSTLSLLDRARNVQAQATRGKGSISQPVTPSSRAHRSGLSLSVPPSAHHSRSGSVQWQAPTPTLPLPVVPHRGCANHNHRRSVSIVSIGSAASTTVDADMDAVSPRRSGRLSIGSHSRTASLQISPMSPYGANSGNPSPRGPTSPAYSRNGHRSPQNQAAFSPRSSATSPGALPDFRFPNATSPLHTVHNTSDNSKIDHVVSPRTTETPLPALPPSKGRTSMGPPPPTTPGPPSTTSEHPGGPAAKIISAQSLADATPRSSTELYALSNNSSETLASEYPSQSFGRNGNSVRPACSRRHSGMGQKQKTEILMGFAQLQGSFTLDGSLVNLNPFDHVKRKGVVGGQGGGVVGVENTKRDSGFFGWGSFKSSISELMGNSELSTIQEMRGAAKSKSIPLLSTPQSVLFVDLRLAPGESKSYEYVFHLPRGLPPSHRGRAMKINYSLVVGTQRAGGPKEHQVRTIDVPFRVLGSVNGRGEILGHDLMNPYILLKDEARTKAMSKTSSRPKAPKKPFLDPSDTREGFFSYVNEILRRPAPNENGLMSGLLSPTAITTAVSRRPSILFDEPASAQESIDLAILRSNMTLDGQQSPNKFEIARNGQRVAVVMLSRPAYRLGETVTLAVDFAKSEIPCYAIHAALETTEKIDPSLAVRSEASIHRVTKKVVASTSEATLYSRRFVFMPTIPILATPEFVTSGINFEWKVRIEFVVPSSATPLGRKNSDGASAMDEAGRLPHPLLEQSSRDKKGGLVMVAVENLKCESFEVAVPLRVYGTVGTGLEKLDRDEFLDEGLYV